MVTKTKQTKQWIDDVVDVGKLNLDLQNPRIPKHVKEQNNETLIRNYLLEKEDVLRIARSIANNGYHKSAISVVFKHNGKLIVLDGNRRLAACQLLLNPELAPNARDKKAIEDLGKILNGEDFKKLKITIAPSRKEAEKEIWDIHVNQLLKPWQVLQKLRMYRNLIDSGDYDIKLASKEYGVSYSKFKKELGRLHFYEQILEQVDARGEEKLQEYGFNAIDRLILSKNGKKLIRYSIDDKGNVVFEDRKNAESKLKKLIPYIIGENKIAAQATQDDLIENVYSKIDPVAFAIKKPSKKKKDQKESQKIAKTKKKLIEDIKSLALKRRRNSRNYPLNEAEDIVEYVLVHFDVVAEQLLDRHDNRETLRINDEYDVQDLLHALLAMFFDDVANEEWNPSEGASPSRGDFLLLDNGTIIEAKTTLKRNGTSRAIRKKLEEELNNDLMQYSRHPKCKRIYLFVYDPQKKIKKHTTFERGVSSTKLKDIKVSTIINRG